MYNKKIIQPIKFFECTPVSSSTTFHYWFDQKIIKSYSNSLFFSFLLSLNSTRTKGKKKKNFSNVLQHHLIPFDYVSLKLLCGTGLSQNSNAGFTMMRRTLKLRPLRLSHSNYSPKIYIQSSPFDRFCCCNVLRTSSFSLSNGLSFPQIIIIMHEKRWATYVPAILIQQLFIVVIQSSSSTM